MCTSGEIERTVGGEKTGGIYVNKIALKFLQLSEILCANAQSLGCMLLNTFCMDGYC